MSTIERARRLAEIQKKNKSNQNTPKITMTDEIYESGAKRRATNEQRTTQKTSSPALNTYKEAINSLVETNLPKYTDNVGQGNFNTRLSENLTPFFDAIGTNTKQALQNVGEGLKNVFVAEVNRNVEATKYDPTLNMAENVGLVKKGYNKKYGEIIDKQIDTSTRQMGEDYTALREKQQKELEKYSSLPQWQQTAANLIGGSAQLIPQVGASFIDPSLGMAILGGQVYGNSYAEAISQGASREDATGYALLSTATEMAIEKAFGGIPKMGNGVLSTKIASGVSKLIQNPVTQNTLKYIFDSVGEGAEEVASEFLAPYIKKATYDDNPAYPTVDDYLMSFGGGAVGSALFGAPRYIGNIRNKNRRSSVLEAETKAGNNGVKTAYELGKSGISMDKVPLASQEQVDAFNRGRMEAIMSMPKETNFGYGKNGNETFNHILESNQDNEREIKTKYQRAYEAGMMNEDAHYTGSIEKSAYEAGKADYNESLQKAIADSENVTIYGKSGGLILNENSKNVDKHEQRLLDALGKATGSQIEFDKKVLDGKANGQQQNGRIKIALDAENPFIVVGKHEVNHRMKELSPREYFEYRNYAVKVLSSQNGQSAATLVEYYQARAKNSGISLSVEEAMDEISADFTERILTNKKDLMAFIETMSETAQKRNILQKFFDAVRRFIDKAKSVFKGDNARVKDAVYAEFGATIEQLEKAEQLWKDTLRASADRVQKTSDINLKNSNDSDIINEKASYSMKDKKWHPDLSKNQLIELMNIIDRDVTTSVNNITDKANWLLTRMNGMSVFAIYSMENTSKPTLMYESKGAQAVFERDVLLDLMEMRENGTSVNGKSNASGRIYVGNWMRNVSSSRSRAESLGRDSSIGNVAVLQGKSRRKTRPAFDEVVRNIFKVQEGIDSESKTQFSLKNNIEQKAVLMHEIQHAIQSSEGFDRGANTEYWKRKKGVDDRVANELYQNTAGEIEARDVSDRLGMTAEERRNTFPESAKGNDKVVFSNSDRSYDLTNDFAHQLDDWLQGGGKKNGTYNGRYFELGTTPDVLVKYGAKSLEVVMPEDCLLKITGSKHSISLDELKKLPQQLNNPIMLFKGSVKNSFVALTEMKMKNGHNAIVAIHLNRYIDRYSINKIASIYSKTKENGIDVTDNYVQNNIDDGNLIYASQKKAPIWFTSRGLQLPKLVQTKLDASFDNSVTQDDPIVNTNIRNNSKNDASDDNSSISFSSNKTIPKGEKPARKIDVPAEDGQGGKVSHGIRTVLEASATPDSYVSPIMEDVLEGKYSHDIITDKMARENAFGKISRIENGTSERVLDAEKFKRVLNDTLERFEDGDLDGKKDVALLHALYTNAANSYDYMNQVDENGVPLAEKLIVAMVQTASKAGQTLQASRLLKKTTPAGKLYDLELFVKNMNKEIKNQWGEWVDNANAEVKEQWGNYEHGKRNYKVDKDAKRRRKESRRRGMAYSKKQKDIVINKKLVSELLAANNQEQATAIEEKLIKDISKQIVATVPDKLRAMRYTAMLANPRTHVRNIVGNTMFSGVVKTRNAIDAVLQTAIIKDKSKRTKTIALSSKQRAERKKLIDYADKVFKEQMQYVRGESGKYDTINNKIAENRRIFGFAPLEWVSKQNFRFLEAEDVIFIRHHFKSHFANALFAKGINLNDIESKRVSNSVIEEVLRYAADQAQKATFRDASNFAKAINKLERTNLGTELAVGGISPFKKTPINILKRGIEYSPTSLVKALGKTISQNASVKKGTLESVDAVGILENLSEGLTGTAIFALGAWLIRTGILAIRPGDGEEEEKLGEAMGHQSYALELDDYSFTIDWAAPAVMPLFIGAECAKSLEGNEGINILETLSKMSDPVIETTMLSGVLGVLNSIRYSESGSDVIADLTSEVMSSYIMQYVPSVFGAVARTFDNVESRTSRPSAAGDEGFLEMLGRKIANKTPILRNVVESKPYIDIMGKHKTKEGAADYVMSIVQNFILPGYISKMTSFDAAKELSDIVDESERTDFIPKYVTKIGEHRLSHNEYYNYHKERGELYDEVIPYLISQTWYKNCTEDQKAELLASFKEAADKLTKKSFRPEYNINDKKLQGIYKNGTNAEDIVDIYLLDKYIGDIADTDGDDEVKKAEFVDVITSMNISSDNAWNLYLGKYNDKTATKAKNHGIDAKLYMTAKARIDSIAKKYEGTGRKYTDVKKKEIEDYLNSVCRGNYKAYLLLHGTEYPGTKNSSDYKKYFGED